MLTSIYGNINPKMVFPNLTPALPPTHHLPLILCLHCHTPSPNNSRLKTSAKFVLRSFQLSSQFGFEAKEHQFFKKYVFGHTVFCLHRSSIVMKSAKEFHYIFAFSITFGSQSNHHCNLWLESIVFKNIISW